MRFPPTHPFLRRLTPPAGLHSITLLGTLHVSAAIPTDFFFALLRAERVLFEQDYLRIAPTPPSRHAVPRDLVGPVVRLADSRGIDPEVLAGLSPLEVGIVLQQVRAELLPMDVRMYFLVAVDRRGGMETAQEIRDCIDRVPVALHRRALTEVLEICPRSMEAAEQHAIANWNAGRIPEGLELFESLVRPRETVWTPRILAAAAESDVTVVCGASHIDGLTERLQLAGFVLGEDDGSGSAGARDAG